MDGSSIISVPGLGLWIALANVNGEGKHPKRLNVLKNCQLEDILHDPWPTLLILIGGSRPLNVGWYVGEKINNRQN